MKPTTRPYHPLFLACLLALWLPIARAEGGPWSLTIYAGRYSNDPLLEGIILGANNIHFDDSHLAAVALAKTMGEPDHNWQWEIEGQYGQHSGLQQHWEANLLAIWRWNNFPWNRWLPTTAAFGEGISYANREPYLEKVLHEPRGTHRTLNYMLFEWTLAPPQAQGRWSIVGRIHHRSGIYGRLHNIWGGSDYISAGIKLIF